MSPTRSPRRVVTALVAALLAGAGTAWATSPEHRGAPTPTPTSTSAPTSEKQLLPPPAAGSVAPSTKAPDRSPRSAARPVGTPEPPTSIVIPRIKAQLPILPVGVASDGQMALPPDPADVGWYRYGSRPGDRAGATVLAAHVDSKEYGIGPMARLGELRAGDVITVLSGSTSRRYLVTSTQHLEKSTLDLTSLFARTGPPRLHLITCGGEFDARERHYEQNVVVLAVPVR